MEGLGKLHLHYKRIEQLGAQFLKGTSSAHHSLPSYVMGTRLGKMCARLREIKTNVKGAGRFYYNKETEDFQGSDCLQITQSSYFEYDK
jgi:hypothetical protein